MRVSEHGLDEVIHSFEQAGARMPEGAHDKVTDALKNIRDEWKHAWTGRFAHAPRIERSISYEMTSKSGFVISGVVGPVDSPVNQGFLGRILELGAEHSGPHPGGYPAADRESPKFEAAVDELLRKLIP